MVGRVFHPIIDTFEPYIYRTVCRSHPSPNNVDPVKEQEEEEEREEFHYNAANRMIASATPIHTTEVGHVIVM